MDSDTARALEQIPSGLFLLTAAYDGSRSCIRVEWVQRCSTTPPLIVAAIASCLPVVPIIRDSHCFALCQVSEDDRFLGRKFSEAPEYGEDPFDTLTTSSAPSGSPIVQRAMSYLDCEVIRHVDLDSEYGLYVGLVRHGAILNDGRPAVLFGNGV